jgi:hypothetical protein
VILQSNSDAASGVFLNILRQQFPLLQSIYLGFRTSVFQAFVYRSVVRALGSQHLNFDLPCAAEMDFIFGHLRSNSILVASDLFADEFPNAFLQRVRQWMLVHTTVRLRRA